MKPILIVENNQTPLKEGVQTGSKKDYVLGGVFTEFGIKNRNDRIYTADKFIPCLEELNERIDNMVVYGEFDHPDVFDTSLARASHLIQSASYVKEHNRVEGEIKLLNTFWGKEAKALVDDNCPVFVSSRAAGITESDGTVTLKKLFTYDIVADPGFASAKMKSINESFGYDEEKTNFRIYEMSNDTKINELFMDNKNDFVTKQQLTDYSKYLINELASTKKLINESVKSGNVDSNQLDKLFEYYEELNKTNSQMVKYFDYLAEKLQVIVNKNESLTETTEKLISHNDYLAENLEKSINYSEYLAENLDKNISYSEYIAENLDKNIEYSEYLAENLDKNISYSEYLAENLDKNIAYSEYIAENLDKNISYSEYLAENLDNSIAYSEYLSEHVEGNIAYSEYIAENLDDNIAYSEYVAENLDKSISYSGLIAEKLNNGKLNESLSDGDKFPTLEEAGFEMNNEEVSEVAKPKPINEKIKSEEEMPGELPDESADENNEEENNNDEVKENYDGNSDTELSHQIDKLIEEAKKRKVSETNDLHFLKFLNKSQVNSYYELTNEEQEQVKLHINERSYYSGSDVIGLINEALSVKNESLEEKLIRLMPENIKPIWEGLNESSRKSILSQARLYPNLDTDDKVEHFWLTRPFKKNESVTKKLVDHQPLIQEDKLSDSDMESIIERFKNI